MAGIQLQFNAQQYNPSTGTADPVCDGWHMFAITDSKLEPMKSGGGNKLVLEMQVQVGDFKGSKYWESYNIQHSSEKTVEIAYENLLAVAAVTCGVEQFKQQQNTGMMFGIPFYAKVATKNDFTNLVNWKPQNDQTVIVATRADAAAAKHAATPPVQQAPMGQPAMQPAGGFQAPAQPQGGFQPQGNGFPAQQPAGAGSVQQGFAPQNGAPAGGAPVPQGFASGAGQQQPVAGVAPQQQFAPQQGFQPQAQPMAQPQQAGFQPPQQPMQPQGAPQQQFGQPQQQQQFAPQGAPGQPAWGQPQ